MSEIKDTIVAAAKKDYSAFQTTLSNIVNQKMGDKVTGFRSYLEKNMFTKKEE